MITLWLVICVCEKQSECQLACIVCWCLSYNYRIGLIYDERMLAHKCIWVPSFPEAPSRLEAALARIDEYRLRDRCIVIPVSYV